MDEDHQALDKAILFDLDGTVIQSEDLWDETDITFLGRRGIEYDQDFAKVHLSGKSVSDGIVLMEHHYRDQLKGDYDDLASERMFITRELLEKKSTFHEGFEAFFQRLQGKYKTCIATAMDNYLLKGVDKKLELYALFDQNVFNVAQVKGKSKPDPAIFEYAAEQLGVRPERCIVIEDAPQGVTAAKNAGMYCIAISNTCDPKYLQNADQIVDRFDQVQLPF